VKRPPGRLGLIGWLTFVWVALWGSVTAANVLGGLVLAVVLTRLLPLSKVPRQGRVRPVALARFVLFFFWELAAASATVTVQVLHPRAELRQAVIAVPMIGTTDRLLTLVANAVSLTPGTLTLEVDRPGSMLYVHALNIEGHPDAVEDVRRTVMRLERLAILALGPQESLTALDQAQRKAGPGARR
jgi:multicomponent Na+:H+ antiporter subunit E